MTLRETIEQAVVDYRNGGTEEEAVDAILAAIADSLTDERVVRSGVTVLVDEIAGVTLDDHLLRVMNRMLKEAGIVAKSP